MHSIKSTLSQAASHSSLRKRRRSSSRSIQPSQTTTTAAVQPPPQIKSHQQTIKQLIAERKQTKLQISELRNEAADLKLKLKEAEKKTQVASLKAQKEA